MQWPARVRARYKFDSVFGCKVTGSNDTAIPTGSQILLEPARHVGQSKAVVQLPARLPTLGYLQQHAADSYLIAEADLYFGHAESAQIFPERAWSVEDGHVTQLLDPPRVMFEGVEMDCLVGPSVNSPIALLVAVQSEHSNRDDSLANALCDCAAATGPRVGNRMPCQYSLDATDQRSHHCRHSSSSSHRPKTAADAEWSLAPLSRAWARRRAAATPDADSSTA